MFDLPIEDFNNQSVEPDIIHIRFHESITLNNAKYTNFYSNENKIDVYGYIRKELVYFNVENGEIAVQDSINVL
ncbi:MAG: hypothetical protein ACI86M_000871 [Saprospiraceae bacterium]